MPKKESIYNFKEWEIVNEREPHEDSVSDDEPLPKIAEFEEKDLKEVDEIENVQNRRTKADKYFEAFRKRMKRAPDQIMRYFVDPEDRIFIAEPKTESVPNCNLCGGKRTLEFQITPQILTEKLKKYQ